MVTSLPSVILTNGKDLRAKRLFRAERLSVRQRLRRGILRKLGMTLQGALQRPRKIIEIGFMRMLEAGRRGR